MAIPYAEVIGDPIAHSKSPLIHNFWLTKLGLEGEYRAIRVPSRLLSDYVATRSADKSWRGCNVTMPHKVAMLELVAHLGDIRSSAGGVNTLFRHTFDAVVGTNTDGAGFLESLRQFEASNRPAFQVPFSVVQIVGAGGAARAVAAVLKSMTTADIYIYNRSLERGKEVALWLGLDPEARARPLSALAPRDSATYRPPGYPLRHLVVNATSLGMNGNPPVPIDLTAYPPDTIVYDLVYAPLETPLLADARANGLLAIDGLTMLIAQAALSFQMFFRNAPPRRLDAELRELLAR